MKGDRDKHKVDVAAHILQNPLQHTALHGNILQHTSTHCNTLQHTKYTVMKGNRDKRRVRIVAHTFPNPFLEVFFSRLE